MKRLCGLRKKSNGRVTRPGVEPLEGRALLAASALDPSFGQGGLVDLSPGGSEVAVQADGKVVVVGTEVVANVGDALIVRRFDVDGSADATFGVAGAVTLAEPEGANSSGDSGTFDPAGLLIQPDGKIVVGENYVPAAPAAGSTATAQTIATEIFRIDADGAADITFGTGGAVTLATDDSNFNALALQPDGKIVAAGSVGPGGSAQLEAAAERLDANGQVDTTFGTGGLFLSFNPLEPFDYITAVAIDPGSGKIVLSIEPLGVAFSGPGGEHEQINAEVIRLDTDGTPDATFGQEGYAPAGSDQTIHALAVQPDGEILAGGESFSGANITVSTGPALVRLDAAGSPESSFAPTFEAGPEAAEFIVSLAIQADGKIVAGLTLSSNNDVAVARFNTDGSRDPGFGSDGVQKVQLAAPIVSSNQMSGSSASLVASTDAPDGKIVLIGDYGTTFAGTTTGVESILARLLPVATTATTAGDYTGAGKSDPAIYLPALDLYAYRPSSGAADVVQQFGIPGAGQTVPAPGDYSGDGTTDVAVYLPSAGEFAIRPSSGGADRIVPFGFAGAGQTIPAVGDYNGDGVADIAAYLPAIASFAIRPSSGGPDEIVPFGFAGAGQTIPAPGDYDGDGKADIAAYLPAIASFAIRPSSGGADEIIPFGMAGVGASIPVPGDYDGSGKTELAVYLPSLGELIYRPAGGGADVAVPFGLAGAGATIPAPGDYDGDGKTDVAAYLPSLGIFAYRPSGGGADVLESFGSAGPGATIPASSLPGAIPGTLTAASVPAASVSSRSEVIVPLTDDLMAIPGQAKRKGAARTS